MNFTNKYAVLKSMKYILPVSISLILLIFSPLAPLHAQKNGYEITVNLENFKTDTLFFGYHFGSKQYIKDTVAINPATKEFVFKGEEALDCGIYLVIMPPENNYFQLLIDDKEQHYSVKTDALNPVKAMKIKGAPENKLFYDYMNFLSLQGPKAKEINEKIKAAKDKKEDSSALENSLKEINKDVVAYQKGVINKSEGLTSRIIKASMEIELPEFGKDEESQRNRYYYIKEHWFDNINLADPCLLRSSILQKKIDGYFKSFTPRNPDSIAISLERVLKMAEPNEETYKYLLIKYLSEYAKSKIVGMDKVYVYLVKNYYQKGKAPWTDEEQLAKIIDDAEKLEPILIGKQAPEISIPELDIDGTLDAMDDENEHKRFKLKEKVALYDIDSPYTIVYIWSPDCGHCKKAMPEMIKVYDKYKDKGVAMYAICHRTYKDTPTCAEYIKNEQPEMLEWLNLNDPYFRSKYNVLYNVKSTPQLYILDNKKEIIMKRVGADQLDEVLTEIMTKDKLKEQNK